MFEFLKDGFEALGQRIRSPFLGSIALVFLAKNWEPLVYLLYADKPIRAKFLYFDANTTIMTLYVIPIFFGILLALFTPWLKLLGAEWAKYPSKRLKVLQDDEARTHRIYEYEQSAAEETALGKLEAAKEGRVIEASKRQKEARDTGVDAEKDLETSRSEDQNTKDQYGLNEIQKLVVVTLGSNADGGMTHSYIITNGVYVQRAKLLIPNITAKRLSVDTQDTLDILKKKGLVSIDSSNRYSLTSYGYRAHDALITD